MAANWLSVAGADSNAGAGGAGGQGAGTNPGRGSPSDASISIENFALVGLVEWLVPAAVLVIPGIIIIAAMLAQVFGGMIWIQLARRFIDERRRRTLANGQRA